MVHLSFCEDSTSMSVGQRSQFELTIWLVPSVTLSQHNLTLSRRYNQDSRKKLFHYLEITFSTRNRIIWLIVSCSSFLAWLHTSIFFSTYYSAIASLLKTSTRLELRLAVSLKSFRLLYYLSCIMQISYQTSSIAVPLASPFSISFYPFLSYLTQYASSDLYEKVSQ